MSNESRSAVVSIQDEQMVQIPKEFFFDGMTLPVPIYVRMTSGNYLIIGKKGDKSNFSTLHGFKNPNFLIFATLMDHPELIQYMTSFTEKVVGQKSVPLPVKTKFISRLAEDCLSCFDGKNFTSTVQLQKVSRMLIDFAHGTAVFSEIMKIIEEMPENESKHSMLTGLIAMSICEEMQLSHGVAHEKVAMASLLHDVGLKFIPKSIMEKPRHQWSPEELAIFETHPIRGVEMLRDLKDIPSDVLLMIVEHHENSQGTGFPKRIRDVKISPLGRILIVANYMSGLLFDSHDAGGKTYTADEAVSYIENILGQPFNRQVFLALKNIVNKQYMVNQTQKKTGTEG